VTGVQTCALPISTGGQFLDLSRLLGTIIGDKGATIGTNFTKGKGNGFEVSVTVGKATIATAKGENRVFEGNATPMLIDQAALNDELGIEGAVRVQKMEVLTVHVAALPGGPLELKGRSGMRGRFHYVHKPLREPKIDEEAAPEAEE
jgi:hypothetical protein